MDILGFVIAFLTNRILVSVFVAFLISQCIKVILLTKSRNGFSLSYLCKDGHMPSGHAATVVAMATSVLFIEGLSTLFYVSLVICAVVLRDATGIRFQSSLHAVQFNRLVKNLKEQSIPSLEEELGHTVSQVIVGCIIGISSAILIFSL